MFIAKTQDKIIVMMLQHQEFLKWATSKLLNHLKFHVFFPVLSFWIRFWIG